MLTLAEENYLKAIYHLSSAGKEAVTTNALAENMNNKAASVTDMVKRLYSKGVITYEKYYGVNISAKGKAQALMVIRKHRLWETFLVEKLGFPWDKVHDVAEQLEHVQSSLLMEKLDEFLGYPAVDPHGHPIPDSSGKIKEINQVLLANWPLHKRAVVRSVKDGSDAFLQYCTKLGIYPGIRIQITEKVEFDGSMEIMVDGKKKTFISREASENLLVTE